MNAAEELTVAWLQEVKHFFTMSNIKVPSESGKGGTPSEIDILAMKPGERVWVEVAVSVTPRGSDKSGQFDKELEGYTRDFFREDKRRKVREIFGTDDYQCWAVHGKFGISKKVIPAFKKAVESKGIRLISISEVLAGLKQLKYYRQDTARAYVGIFSTFMGRE